MKIEKIPTEARKFKEILPIWERNANSKSITSFNAFLKKDFFFLIISFIVVFIVEIFFKLQEKTLDNSVINCEY